MSREDGTLVRREGGDYDNVMVPLTHEKSSAYLASSFGNTACLSKRSSSSYMFPYMNPVNSITSLTTGSSWA